VRLDRRARTIVAMPILAAVFLAAVGLGGPIATAAPTATAQRDVPRTSRDVATALNNEPAQRITARNQSWRPIFDAYLDMTAPPFPIGPDFNVRTIHPGMRDWDKVATWAERNSVMGDALIAVRNTIGFALPYGEENVDERYRNAGLVVRLGVAGDVRRIEYPYIRAIDTIAAYAVAETYRRIEAGDVQGGFAIGTSALRLLRQLADRVMLAEKAYFIELLADSLSVHRDIMWKNRDRITAVQFRELALNEYPQLDPGRARLEMPEGDRIVAEAILKMVFDDRGQPVPERFADVFGEIQSQDKPLTRFGAVRRWNQIASVHGSLDASQQKLTNIYDDWWRRWRMRQYDPMMELSTELSRTNPIRYGAVIYSIRDIQDLFELRRRLVAEINGAAMAAGFSGYRREFNAWPDDREKAYTTFVRKLSDFDPWDKSYGRLRYRWLGTNRRNVDTPAGRVFVEGGVLYARGADHEDGDFLEHTPSGVSGDLVLWPPMRALQREQGLID